MFTLLTLSCSTLFLIISCIPYSLQVWEICGDQVASLASCPSETRRKLSDESLPLSTDSSLPSKVETYPNFLSDAESDAILKYHQAFNQAEKKDDMHEKAIVPVSTEVVKRITNLYSKKNDDDIDTGSPASFQMLMVHRTSYLHKDEDDEGLMTVIVFLETNPDAYFYIEEANEKISIERGKLVAFDSRFSHKTVLDGGGTVYMLGPSRVSMPQVDSLAETKRRQLDSTPTTCPVPAGWDEIQSVDFSSGATLNLPPLNTPVFMKKGTVRTFHIQSSDRKIRAADASPPSGLTLSGLNIPEGGLLREDANDIELYVGKACGGQFDCAFTPRAWVGLIDYCVGGPSKGSGIKDTCADPSFFCTHFGYGC